MSLHPQKEGNPWVACSSLLARCSVGCCALITVLLLIEYSVLSLYYEHGRMRQTNKTSALREKRLDATTVPNSRGFIMNQNLIKCRFPTYFDDEYNFHYLYKNDAISPGLWREPQYNLTGSEPGYDTDEVKWLVAKMQSARDNVRYSNGKRPVIKKNITYVHVGKAGGSSISCLLRAGRVYSGHCDNQDETVLRRIPESAISRSVNCYTHWDMNLLCYEINQAFLINVRNPLLRIASWFTYEHIENHEVVYPDKDYHW